MHKPYCSHVRGRGDPITYMCYATWIHTEHAPLGGLVLLVIDADYG